MCYVWTADGKFTASPAEDYILTLSCSAEFWFPLFNYIRMNQCLKYIYIFKAMTRVSGLHSRLILPGIFNDHIWISVYREQST